MKDPRADAKLQSLPDEELETLWRFRHPETGGQKLTLEAIAAEEVPLRYGFTIALSSLSRFYRWLKLKREMDRRFEAAEQLKADLAKDGTLSDEQIDQAGQRMFKLQGMLKKDVRMFGDMVRIGQSNRAMDQKDEQLRLLKEAGKRDARRIRLLERKAQQLQAAKDVIKSAATVEEQNRQLREILK